MRTRTAASPTPTPPTSEPGPRRGPLWPRQRALVGGVALALLVATSSCSRAKPASKTPAAAPTAVASAPQAEKPADTPTASTPTASTPNRTPPTSAQPARVTPGASAAKRIFLATDLPPTDLQPLVDRFAARERLDLSPYALDDARPNRRADILLVRDLDKLKGVRLRRWPADIAELTLPASRDAKRTRLVVGLGLRLFVASPEADVADLGEGGLQRRLGSDVERLGWCPSCPDGPALVADMIRLWGAEAAAPHVDALQRRARRFPTTQALFAAVLVGEVEVGIVTHGDRQRAQGEHKRLRFALSSLRHGPMAVATPLVLALPRHADRPRPGRLLARLLLTDPAARQLLDDLGFVSAAVHVEPAQAYGPLLDRLHIATRPGSVRLQPRPSPSPSVDR